MTPPSWASTVVGAQRLACRSYHELECCQPSCNGARAKSRGDLGLGQLLSSHHSCLPGIPEAGRRADPGEEVDQGGALETEGGRPLLAGAAVSGAPSDRPGKTVTDPPAEGRARYRSQGHLCS